MALVVRGVLPEVAEEAAYFHCEGRYAGAQSSEGGPDGCNWTLGGLFRIHTVCVVHPESGADCPVFIFDHPDADRELASATAALAALAQRAPEAAPGDADG
jgi:hypothetical protein